VDVSQQPPRPIIPMGMGVTEKAAPQAQNRSQVRFPVGGEGVNGPVRLASSSGDVAGPEVAQSSAALRGPSWWSRLPLLCR